MEYIYKPEGITYRKTEDDGVSIILTSAQNNQLFLNATGTEILNMLPEYKSSSSLLETLEKEYPDVDSRVLEFDLLEILKLLEIYGIVAIESENNGIDRMPDIYPEEDALEYSLAGDLNYKRISDFISGALTDNSIKHYVDIDPKYYAPQFMRLRVMQNLEYGIFASKHNDLHGYVSVSFPVDYSTVMVINSAFFKNEMSISEMSIVFIGMINRFLRLALAQKTVKKIRITFFSDEKNNEFLKVITEAGFRHEVTLKDETIKGDMIFYYYPI